MGRLSWVFVVSITGGYPEKEILAIRADGAGDVTKSHVGRLAFE
jgi:hypothetical protein